MARIVLRNADAGTLLSAMERPEGVLMVYATTCGLDVIVISVRLFNK